MSRPGPWMRRSSCRDRGSLPAPRSWGRLTPYSSAEGDKGFSMRHDTAIGIHLKMKGRDHVSRSSEIFRVTSSSAGILSISQSPPIRLKSRARLVPSVGAFLPVAEADEVPPGTSKVVVVSGHLIALFNVDGT